MSYIKHKINSKKIYIFVSYDGIYTIIYLMNKQFKYFEMQYIRVFLVISPFN